MPIITSSGNPQPSMNGDTSLLNSLDDDSFVVLERSTANDLDFKEDVPSQTSQSLQTQGLPNCSFPVFNNRTLTASQTSHHSQDITLEELVIPFDSANISVSVEDIEKRLQEVLHENINLKENLYQTNLAMKQQLSTVRLLQERAVDVQKNQQAKFEDTKELILKLESEKNKLMETNTSIIGELNKLKEENNKLSETNIVFGAEEPKLREEVKELKQANVAFAAEAAKLLSENAELKKELSSLQETVQTMTENNRKVSLQPTTKEVELHEIVDQLTRKLEVVERARRQQEFDIDRLQAQLGKATQQLNDTQRKLAHVENALEAAQTQTINANTKDLGEKTLKYDDLLKQLSASIQEEQTRFNSLHSFLTLADPAGNSAQFEISELRHLLAEEQSQSVARKENLYKAVSTINELLNDYKKLREDLERVKADYAVKESHGMAYDAMQKKGFTERIDVLTAKLVEKEEALAISERHLASLQEAVRLQNAEKKDDEEVRALKEQVKSLTSEVSVKEEKIRANIEELNLLKGEVEGLRSAKETIEVLEEQAKIFQADFDVERKARESLVEEKNRLMEDFRHLQRRNQDLIEEINRSRNEGSIASAPQPDEVIRNTAAVTQNRSPPIPVLRPQDDIIPPPKKYYCPNPECNMIFSTVDPLQLHVITCLKLDD